MRRREFLVAGSSAAALISTNIVPAIPISLTSKSEVLDDNNKLTPPDGPIIVAFAISRGATMIDFAGPWEVFQDVMLQRDGNHRQLFRARPGNRAGAPGSTDPTPHLAAI